MDAKVKAYLADAFNALVSESNETHHVEQAVDAREYVMAWIARVEAERDKALAEVGSYHKPAVFDDCSREDRIRYGRKWLGLDREAD